MSLLTDLVSYWKLDEASGNALDAHGSNTLTETSGTIGTASGKISNARDFEADDTEYFTANDNASLSTGDIDFTFSAWVRFESFGDRPRILCKINSGVTVLEHQLFYKNDGFDPNNRFVWEVFNGTSSVGLVAANNFGAPSLSTWYHIICWHDAVNNLVGISVNNGTPDTASTTGAPADTSAPFSIGSLSGFSVGYLDGLIDEVVFWKRMLTSQERTDLYNSGNGLPYSSFGGGTVYPNYLPLLGVG